MKTSLFFALGACACVSGSAQAPSDSTSGSVNLAVVATPSTSFVSGHETLGAVNDGYAPQNSGDKRHGAYGNWPRKGAQWVQYEWSQPVNINRTEVYWFSDGGGVRLPVAARLLYWDGTAFVPVKNPVGLGAAGDTYNTTAFDAVTASKLKLEFDSLETASTGILEFKVYDAGNSPRFPPLAEAGVDRVVVMTGKTWLSATTKAVATTGPLKMKWGKKSGPGTVKFEQAEAAETTARFTQPGAYVLTYTVDDGNKSASDTLNVRVEAPPPAVHLDPVYTKTYKVNSPLWNSRVKKLITHWIPHCYTKISDPDIPEGGIENFTQAGLKNAGKPFARHRGPVFANAWVHNTFEAMCVAMMVDPQGDPEIISARNTLRTKIADWLPKLLSAQEADGYLQTCYTLGNLKRWTNKADHEGYLAGYFMEAAMAHYLMTDRKDPRMYEAAKRLADCWYNNIGPAPKQAWYEGHQELEQALVRLGRFVEDVEGSGKGSRYIELAKFLMDSRKGGDEYDQSHLPVIQQYEAVGHAVRAVYCYAGMADIAMETGDVDYQSAVLSIWDNIVNKKYYVTGGVGSGETSEGFGKNYSLPNNAYCESCSGSGELFFQHKMNMTYHDAK
ncbi:MAG: beta-L-arabinofuranosidase domain-containing protein, partial [bacterium]